MTSLRTKYHKIMWETTTNDSFNGALVWMLWKVTLYLINHLLLVALLQET